MKRNYIYVEVSDSWGWLACSPNLKVSLNGVIICSHVEGEAQPFGKYKFAKRASQAMGFVEFYDIDFDGKKILDENDEPKMVKIYGVVKIWEEWEDE